VPCITTLPGALAAAEGIAALRRGALTVLPLQRLGVAAEAAATPSPAG
jgi:hypothetical protein